MRKIGFIDYFIDEWHANNYPAMIRNSGAGDRYEVSLAWEEFTPKGKKGLPLWCEEQGVGKASSLEEVVEKCDCLIVLSPDNPERHEELADLPLQSGKPVYIDKPFAPSWVVAKRLFDKAQDHGTPLMSCSALRYGSGLQNALKDTLSEKKVNFIATAGGGTFPVYAIHQFEMLVMTLGLGARRIMQCGNRNAWVTLVDYEDGRRGLIQGIPGQPFRLACQYDEDGGLVIEPMNDFFEGFIKAMLEFFYTGQSLVPEAETLEIVSLCETGIKALEKPDCWLEIPCP